jgi:hypothetical protein
MSALTRVRLIARGAVAAPIVAVAAAVSFAQPPTGPAATTALPFSFTVSNVEVHARGQVLLADRFQPRTTLVPSTSNRGTVGNSPYVVNVGRLPTAKFLARGLVLDQTTTGAAMWNVSATMVTLPAGPNGAYTLSGAQFPLEVSATLQQPRIKGAEKFMVGIVDQETLHAVALLTIGIPGIPGRFPPIGGGGGGGGGGGPSKDNLKNKGQEVINPDPSIMLMREEEPEIREHIVLDNVAAPGLNTATSITLTVRIGENGEISGLARIAGGQQPGEMTLTPKIDPQFEGFYRARSRLDTKGTAYSAVLYAENLPRVRVFSVDKPVVTGDALRSNNGTVPIAIHGVGLGLDSKVEIVPVGGGTPARVSNIQLANLNLLLTADVTFPEPRAARYQVRVTSAGQVATAPLSVRVQ